MQQNPVKMHAFYKLFVPSTEDNQVLLCDLTQDFEIESAGRDTAGEGQTVGVEFREKQKVPHSYSRAEENARFANGVGMTRQRKIATLNRSKVQSLS